MWLKRILMVATVLIVAVIIIVSSTILIKLNTSDKPDTTEATGSDNIDNVTVTPVATPASEPTVTVTPVITPTSMPTITFTPITIPTEEPADTSADGQEVIQQKIVYMLAETKKDPQLEDAIKKEINFPGKEDIESTRYYYNMIDLNDDGTDEVFVELVGPYTSGTGGDTTLLFAQSKNGFRPLQRLTTIINPIIISDEKTNGWHDLIIEQSGGGSPSQMVRLKYNGKKYPNPSGGEQVSDDTSISGVGIISNDIADEYQVDKGLYLTASNDITYEDQKAFEATIKAFFAAFEKGDYDTVASYCAKETAFSEAARNSDVITCPLNIVVQNNLPVQFESMQGYILSDGAGADFNITKDTPTVNFLISYTYTDLNGEKQSDGYYIHGVKENDQWLIDGFATSY